MSSPLAPKTSAQAFGIATKRRTTEGMNKWRETVGTVEPYSTALIVLVTPLMKTAIPTDKGPTPASFTTHAQTVVIIGITFQIALLLSFGVRISGFII